ncbi:hypothetical protein KQI58_16330 [Enterococcus raffinosus]|jgi:Ni,Fe-hydrogenase maturation factor|uniref:hypothetical protein n=1 Tax=Enterococcus raffinosus TaxID=71452 RepID=UPI001C10FA5F|nr:hypothetical protein [Enterococcus raffinosus]MBU5362641.1 hypothetical protein [Enterococcus raffinosus]
MISEKEINEIRNQAQHEVSDETIIELIKLGKSNKEIDKLLMGCYFDRIDRLRYKLKFRQEAKEARAYFMERSGATKEEIFKVTGIKL